MNRILPLALCAGGLLAGASAQDRVHDAVNRLLGLESSALVRLDVTGTVGEPVSLDVPLDGRTYLLELRPHSIRSDAFEVLEALAGGATRTVDTGPARTLRGALAGDPGSWAAGSLLDDGLYARVRTSSGQQYWIEPVVGRVPGGAFGDYVVYRDDQHAHPMGRCAADEIPGNVQKPVRDGGGPTTSIDGTVWEAELACEGDFPFHNTWGGVAGATNRIELVINTMNPQYETEVNITHVLTTILIRSAGDPYTTTNPSSLLTQFQNEWNVNQQGVQRDVAELFTGRNLDGSVIGIATLGTVCFTTSAYNVCQNLGSLSCATDLSAHELGHNWNADHCFCGGNTMNSGLTCANDFHDDETVPDILAFRNTRTCLDLDINGTQVFVDDFESGDLTTGGWEVRNKKSKAKQGAAFRGDWGARVKKKSWMEKAQSTVGFNSITVEYATQSMNGHQLRAEWWNGSAWVTIADHDDDVYRESSFRLPAAAGNNPDFKLRFRGLVKGPLWKTRIDDVRIIGN